MISLLIMQDGITFLTFFYDQNKQFLTDKRKKLCMSHWESKHGFVTL